MSIKKFISVATIEDDSKSILYRNKAFMLQDIWQPYEIAKIKAAVLILKAKSVLGLPEQNSKDLEIITQELLEQPVEQFEQKIAGRGAEFQITYNTEDGDILFCGNTIHPFVIPKPKIVIGRI